MYGTWVMRFNALENSNGRFYSREGEIPVSSQIERVEETISIDWSAERCYQKIMMSIDKWEFDQLYDFSVVLGTEEYRKLCAICSRMNQRIEIDFVKHIRGHKIIVVPGNYIGITFENDPFKVIAFDHFKDID